MSGSLVPKKAFKPVGESGPEARVKEFAGVKSGQRVDILDPSSDGWTYTFLAHITPHNGKPFCEVIAKKRTKQVMRYISPERILDWKTKEAVISRAET